MQRARYGLRKIFERLLNEISAVFRFAVQRYDEHLPFSKFLGQKMQTIFILLSPHYKTTLFSPISTRFYTKYYIITLLQKIVSPYQLMGS